MPNLPQNITNITIEGAVDGVVFKHTGSGNVANVPKGATFKNVTFNFGNENYHGFQHAGTIDMEGCTLNGKLFSYGDMNFTNCTFVQDNADYHMWVYSSNSPGYTITYTDCTFTNKATGKFLNIYHDQKHENEYTVIVNGCEFFNESGSANKAALNVKATCKDNNYYPLRYNVIVNNCTTEGAFPEASVSDELVVLNKLVQVDDRKAGAEEFVTVTQDGKKIYPVNYVAKIGYKNFTSLEAAFAAAQDGETVTLLADCTGNGIKAPQGKFTTGLTVDFAGHTYTVDGATVGSAGTETNGFQLLKDNKITFKGGTITSEKAKILIQNYSNLTLKEMTLTLNKEGYTSAYTLSNNNGTVVIDGTTINANPAGGFAFDVCRYASYPSVNVTVKGESVINGDAEVSASGSDAKDGFKLMLEAGTMTGNIVLDASAKAAMAAAPEKALVMKSETFTKDAPADYKWVTAEEGTLKLVAKEYVAQIGNNKYETLEAAFAAAQNDETITLLADIDATEQIEVGKQVTLDLNGKTIEYKGETTLTSGVIMVLRGGDLTVTDTSEGATGAIKSGTKAYAAIALTKKGETGSETAKLTVNNGTLEGYYYAITGNGSRHGTEITINGGVIKGTADSNQGIYHPQEGTLTINGGAISGYSSAVELRAGTLNITGGTLSASCTEFNYEPNNSGSTTDGAVIAIAQHSTLKAINVSIAGATLNGAKTIAVTDAQNNNLKDITVSVADGLTEKAYIPEGFKWVSADGMSTLTKKEYVAQVGDVKYETLKEALDAAKDNEDIVVELLADATLDVTAWSGTKNPLAIGTESTKSITINGNSHTLTFNQKNSDWNNVATMNDAETKLILNDMALTSSGYNNGPWNRHDINFNCAVELNNVTSDKALAFKNDATLKNVTVTDESGSVYGIWVQPNGQNISIDGLNVTAERGIKIDEQYVNDPEKVTLDIAHATFNTTKKAGVLVKSKGGAEISVGEGINIENVAADKENLVWVDEASATEFYKVTVAGATVVPESKVSDYVACVMNGEQSWGFYKKLSDAVNNVEEGYSIKLHQTTAEAVEVSKALTITKNGFTADNVTAGEGFKKFETETEIVIKVFNPVCAIDDVKYETLTEAIAAATAGQTITLLADIDATEQIEVGKQVTLDLNGKTIEYKGETTLTSGVIMVLRGGDLTVTDTSEGATGAIKSGTKAYAAIALTKKGETGSETAKLTVNNGTLEGYYYAITGNGSRHGTEITIAGGTVKGTNEKSNQGIYHPQDGTLTISGGTISGYSSAVELRAGTLNITGGTLSASCTDFNYQPNQSGTTTDGAVIAIAQHSTLKAINVSIAGATLNGAKTIAVTDAQNNNLKDITVSVADGLTEKAYIPEGFKWVSADGMSTLTKKEYVAQVGDVKYETLREALDAAKDNENIVVELLADAVLDVTAWSGEKNALSIGSANTETITINGNSHQLTFNNKNSDWNNIATMNDAETKLVLNNMSISNSGYNNGPWNRHDINFNCAVELNNVTSDKALAFKNDASLKNVTVTETGDVYAIWVQPHGQNISIDGLTINAANGRGIKIDDQYVDNPGQVTLDIANATFNTKKKSAILVKSAANTVITAGEGINIENVASDKENLVWVDEDRAEEFYKVTVAGATVVPESKVSDYVACVMNGEQSWGFYKKLSDAVNNVEEGYSIKLHQTTAEAVEVSKALTITKNGFTADNVTAGEGFKKFETETEIVIKSFNPVCAIGDEKYESLQEAVNAAGTNAATITLLTDAATDGVITGNGVKVQAGQNITFDLKGLTYNVDKTVGSAGTETNGFQLLKGSTVKFTNGTLTSAAAKILLQNYSDLTLDGVTVNAGSADYAVSNNFGSLTVTGETNINAKEGGVAFDLWYGMDATYDDGLQVTFDENFTGKVTGKVEYGHDSRVTDENWQEKASLVIKAGEFDIEYANGSAGALNGANIKISGGSFLYEVPEAYCAEGYVPVELENGRYSVQTKEEAGIFELIDGEPYERTADVQAKKVTYTRTFPHQVSGHLQCWVVPFDYEITEEDMQNLSFYKTHLISAVESATGGLVKDDSKVYLYYQPVEVGTVLKANKPYFVKVNKETKENKTFTFAAEDVTLKAKNDDCLLNVSTSRFNFDFYAAYVSGFKPEAEHWLGVNGSGNLFWNKLTSTLASSYRWYIKVTDNENDYAKITFEFIEEGDATTTIENGSVDSNADIEGFYTVGGVKLNTPAKGLNIVKYTDGTTKKVYIKK